MKYETMNHANEELLKQAIDKAIANGHDVYFNVYNECDRADGRPRIEKVASADDAYECDIYEENGKECIDIYFARPEFDKGGCADLIIQPSDDEYYYVLYQDSTEERVYVEEINAYLLSKDFY